MKSKLYAYALTMSSIAMLLTGCGNGGGGPQAANTLHESTACISCHEDPKWVTPGTGKPLVAGWKLSTHMTANGAGCADCHDDGYMHPESCNRCHSVGTLAKNPTKNPDQAGKCAKCHDKVNPRPGQNDGFKTLTYSDPGIPAGSTTAYTHFSTGRHGNYVASNYKQYCRKCHDPHDTSFGSDQRKQWAESGHGSTRSAFVTNSTDFKSQGSRLILQDNYGPYCVRCHTTTGFVKFVRSNFTDVQALPDLDGVRNNYPERPRPTYQDKSREPINCNACHSDGRADDESSYSGKVREIPPFSVWYMYSSHPLGVTNTIRARMNVQFDSLGTSNLCATCHSGRESGDIIKVADRLGLFTYTGTTNATRPSGISPHDFAAGANLQGKSGFHFYTSSAKYVFNPAHKTGSAIIGGARGACIGCHMKTGQPHGFRPVTWQDNILYATILSVPGESNLCKICHTGTTDNPLRSAAFMNIQRDYFRAAQLALATMIPANRNWKIFGNAIVPGSGPGPGYTGGDAIGQGAYTMGANFISSLFSNDPGAYTHNPTYTKQLIYDSIDWLVDGKMDYGNASTQVYNKVNAVTATLTYSKGGVIYGQNGIPMPPAGTGVAFTKTQVLNFICKDYDVINAPTVCNRW